MIICKLLYMYLFNINLIEYLQKTSGTAWSQRRGQPSGDIGFPSGNFLATHPFFPNFSLCNLDFPKYNVFSVIFKFCQLMKIMNLNPSYNSIKLPHEWGFDFCCGPKQYIQYNRSDKVVTELWSKECSKCILLAPNFLLSIFFWILSEFVTLKVWDFEC